MEDSRGRWDSQRPRAAAVFRRLFARAIHSASPPPADITITVAAETRVKKSYEASSHPTHTQELAASWRHELPGRDLSDFLLAIFLMRLGRVLDDRYDRMCRDRYGISGADMRVLFALRRSGAPYARRPTDLFRALLVTSGAMTKQVDRLGALGFVERRPDPNYAGGALIKLTTRGLRVANEATETLARESVASPVVAGMSKADRATVQRLIEQMLENLDRSDAGGGSPGERSAAGRRARREKGALATA